MKLELKCTCKIDDVKEAWEELYSSNPSLTPFQEFYYCKCMMKYYKSHLLTKLKVPVFLQISDAETKELLLVAPLVKFYKKGVYGIYGDVRGCGITNFIYRSSLTVVQMEHCLKEIIGFCKGKLTLTRLDENSLVCQAAHHLFPNLEEEDFPMVGIGFPDNYDEYFATLSQNTRQNIHKIFNRLKRDEVDWHAKVFMPTSSNPHYEDCLNTFITRQCECYNHGVMGIDALSRLKFRYMVHDTKSLHEAKNSFCASVTINGKVAATMFGLVSLDGTRVVVPRVAIDPAFKFYSPGLLLVSETIKWMIENTDIRYLDLTRGEERYKYTMGGVKYFTKKIKLRSC